MSTMSRRRSKRGYTAVEVLIAMTLFAIGAAGVIGMQKVALQGNADARRADVATGISAEWLSRLRRDSLRWTQPNEAIDTSNHAATFWLGDTVLLTNPIGANAGWKLPAVPPASPIGGSYAFDVMGREVVPGAADTFFCVNYRLDWLNFDAAKNFGLTIRAEVRVFWPRLESSPSLTCAPADVNGANAQQLYHFVYATTTLRRNAT